MQRFNMISQRSIEKDYILRKLIYKNPTFAIIHPPPQPDFWIRPWSSLPDELRVLPAHGVGAGHPASRGVPVTPHTVSTKREWFIRSCLMYASLKARTWHLFVQVKLLFSSVSASCKFTCYISTCTWPERDIYLFKSNRYFGYPFLPKQGRGGVLNTPWLPKSSITQWMHLDATLKYLCKL